jgi:hypothetical protein
MISNMQGRAGSAEARCTCPPGLIQSELLALHSALRASERGSCVIGGASGIENADVFSTPLGRCTGRHWTLTHTDTR